MNVWVAIIEIALGLGIGLACGYAWGSAMVWRRLRGPMSELRQASDGLIRDWQDGRR